MKFVCISLSILIEKMNFLKITWPENCDQTNVLDYRKGLVIRLAYRYYGYKLVLTGSYYPVLTSLLYDATIFFILFLLFWQCAVAFSDLQIGHI
jgi:hypothetical protein